MSDQDQRDLIGRAKEGDRAALGALVRAHQKAVHRFARTLTYDEASAEDVLQETFIAAVKRLDGYRGDGSFRSWLFTIAKRVAIRSARRRAGEPERIESLDALGVRAGWGATDESFEKRIAQREALEHAFARLSDEDREVLFLRDVEGLDGDETAAVLEIGRAAMKSRLHRARLRLAAELREGGEDRGARS